MAIDHSAPHMTKVDINHDFPKGIDQEFTNQVHDQKWQHGKPEQERYHTSYQYEAYTEKYEKSAEEGSRYISHADEEYYVGVAHLKYIVFEHSKVCNNRGY